MFRIKKVLEENGNEVVPFSIRNKKNEETPYSKYFISPISGEEKVYFEDYKLNLKTILQLVDRTFYSLEAKKGIERVIKDEEPDVLYMLHFINKMSPSIIDGAKRYKKRVVARLSDFFLMCPSFHFLRNDEICEECMKYNRLKAIKYKCVKNSLAVSVMKVASMYFHDLIGVYNRIDKFITPSLILKNKLVESGFNPDKIEHIPTFIDLSGIEPCYENENYILYLGRIEKDKGVHYLLKAFEELGRKDIRLLFVGNTQTEECRDLIEYVNERKIKNVEFPGFTSGVKLNEYIRKSLFVVAPSIWYDNMPNSILEAFAYGKPVIASKLGSLPEIVEDRVNGLTFAPRDVNDLAEKMETLLKGDNIIKFGHNARKKAEIVYSPERHYKKLIEVLRKE
jgi:glycosyltransferase involved in cell wall biosynthesis